MQAAKQGFKGINRAIIHMVLSEAEREDTGTMALQCLGILWIIYEYSSGGYPVTTARLKALTRIHSTSIIKYAERLEKLGLIKRKLVTASHGKGRAWEYHPDLPEALIAETIRLTMSELPPVEPNKLPHSS
jgi:hypothetical protein